MTDAQFEALATLIRSRSKSRQAVRLVLVDGLKASEAAAATGLDRSTISNALKVFRNALTLAYTAAGITEPP